MKSNKSYHWICENCSEEVPVSRFCPSCAHQQQRAFEAIEKMRNQNSIEADQ